MKFGITTRKLLQMLPLLVLQMSQLLVPRIGPRSSPIDFDITRGLGVLLTIRLTRTIIFVGKYPLGTSMLILAGLG